MTLDAELMDRALQLTDEMTGELIADLDAALGAAAEWCRQGDGERAAQELADAATLARILEARLGELRA